MGRLSDLGKQAATEGKDYEEIEMSLRCAHCFEYCSKARYFPLTGMLSWKCSEGHKNLMENFFV